MDRHGGAHAKRDRVWSCAAGAAAGQRPPPGDAGRGRIATQPPSAASCGGRDSRRWRLSGGLSFASGRDTVVSTTDFGETARSVSGRPQLLAALSVPTRRSVKKSRYFSDYELLFPGSPTASPTTITLAGGSSVIPGSASTISFLISPVVSSSATRVGRGGRSPRRPGRRIGHESAYIGSRGHRWSRRRHTVGGARGYDRRGRTRCPSHDRRTAKVSRHVALVTGDCLFPGRDLPPVGASFSARVRFFGDSRPPTSA